MRLLVSLFSALLLLTACAPGGRGGLQPERPATDPALAAELMPVINEYLDLRIQAVVSGSTDALWARFPDLSRERDPARGINAEPEHVEGFRTLKPISGRIDPEHYEVIKFAATQREVRADLHGMELYRWREPSGTESDAGGEFMLSIHLREQENGWQVVKTDEVTLTEHHQQKHR